MSEIDNNDHDGPDDDGNDPGDGNKKRPARKKGDYEVGYGKPPKHSQFRTGQSGNPNGPKKGSRGLKKDLHKALNSKQSVRVNGKLVKGTTQELAIQALTIRAAAGQLSAIRQLVELILQIFGPEDRGRERNALPPQDEELLERLLGRMDPDDEDGDGEAGGEEAGGPASDARDSDTEDPKSRGSEDAADRKEQEDDDEA